MCIPLLLIGPLFIFAGFMSGGPSRKQHIAARADGDAGEEAEAGSATLGKVVRVVTAVTGGVFIFAAIWDRKLKMPAGLA